MGLVIRSRAEVLAQPAAEGIASKAAGFLSRTFILKKYIKVLYENYIIVFKIINFKNLKPEQPPLSFSSLHTLFLCFERP